MCTVGSLIHELKIRVYVPTNSMVCIYLLSFSGMDSMK